MMLDYCIVFAEVSGATKLKVQFWLNFIFISCSVDPYNNYVDPEHVNICIYNSYNLVDAAMNWNIVFMPDSSYQAFSYKILRPAAID